MLKYIVIAVIVLICIGFLTGYLFLNRKEDDSGRFEKKGGFQGDLSDDDIEELEKLKRGGEEPKECEEIIPDFPDESDDRPTLYSEPETSEKDNFKDFTFFDESEEEPKGEKRTKPFAGFEEEKAILDYRVIIGGKSREDSLFAGKELYRIGKNKHSDIVLETSDDHVSRDFLTLEPVSGKNIFCLKRVREDFVLPVWSEEEGKWTPHRGEILFGEEQQMIIALTQWKKVTDKNISRLELAVPGCLQEEEPEETAYDFEEKEPVSEDDDLEIYFGDHFDI